jgi:signal recognition particle subunit SRP54
LLVAADLQRPNAVGQLQIVAEQAGVASYAPEPGNGVGDPVQVARDSIDFARRAQHDMVVIDTAGRLGVDADMMAQAEAIRDAVDPQEILFVVDAMVGQDAVNTAAAFRDGVGFSGVVLTKLDGDARGGAALSVRYVTGQPIMFASNGEKLTDFDVFHPDRMASRILGMGDILSLVEEARAKVDEKEAQKLADKFKKGKDFDLEDFKSQLAQMKNMGGIGGLADKLPAQLTQMAQQSPELQEKALRRTEGIINAMTPAERRKPELLKASRKRRIAAGAGVQVQEVNRLLAQFEQMQKMMKMMRGGNLGKMLRGMKGMMPRMR